LRRLEVNGGFIFGRRFDRKIGGLFAAQDAVCVSSSAKADDPVFAIGRGRHNDASPGGLRLLDARLRGHDKAIAYLITPPAKSLRTSQA